MKKDIKSTKKNTVSVKSNSEIDHSEEKRLSDKAPNGVTSDGASTKKHPLFSFKGMMILHYGLILAGKKRVKKDNEPSSPRKRQYSHWVDLSVFQPPTPIATPITTPTTTPKKTRGKGKEITRTPTREKLTSKYPIASFLTCKARMSKRKNQRNSGFIPPSVKVEEDSDEDVVEEDSESDSPEEEAIIIPSTPSRTRGGRFTLTTSN
jgi:hypothetical protein